MQLYGDARRPICPELMWALPLHHLQVSPVPKVSSMHACSVASDFATPRTVAHQAPLSMGVLRQEYWSRLPFPSPGDLPDPEVKPGSSALQANSLPLSHLPSKHNLSYLQDGVVIQPHSPVRPTLPGFHWYLLVILSEVATCGNLFVNAKSWPTADWWLRFSGRDLAISVLTSSPRDSDAH